MSDEILFFQIYLIRIFFKKNYKYWKIFEKKLFFLIFISNIC
jgi:hypothetical protein